MIISHIYSSYRTLCGATRQRVHGAHLRKLLRRTVTLIKLPNSMGTRTHMQKTRDTRVSLPRAKERERDAVAAVDAVHVQCKGQRAHEPPRLGELSAGYATD